MVQIEPKLAKIVQDGSNGSKKVKMDKNVSNWDKMDQKRAKWVKIGPNLAKNGKIGISPRPRRPHQCCRHRLQSCGVEADQ